MGKEESAEMREHETGRRKTRSGHLRYLKGHLLKQGWTSMRSRQKKKKKNAGYVSFFVLCGHKINCNSSIQNEPEICHFIRFNRF